MSTQAAISPRHHNWPSLRLPHWPRRMGKLLLGAMQAHADALCLAYSAPLGTGSKQRPVSGESD
jgi:hypothetical protein